MKKFFIALLGLLSAASVFAQSMDQYYLLQFDGTPFLQGDGKEIRFGAQADCVTGGKTLSTHPKVVAKPAAAFTCPFTFRVLPATAPPLPVIPSDPTGSAPQAFFSDLDGGTNTGGQDGNGVFVSIFGKGFGATRGTSTVTVGGGAVAGYPVWSDTKVVVQLGAAAKSGGIVVTTAGGASNAVPFAVREGTILFVTPTGTGDGSFAKPTNPADALPLLKPGVVAYFRAGTYDKGYGNSYGRNFALISAYSGSAFVGYPGETATLVAPAGQGRTNFAMRGQDDSVASRITIANFVMKGEGGNIEHGGITNTGAQVGHSGASNVRFIGNTLSANYTNNTMTGLITVGGDGARIYGNTLQDTGTTPPINNNHGVYIQLGASDVDVGWNVLRRLKMGHTIQVHTDLAFKYENVRIHDNVMSAVSASDTRGINIGNILPGSSGAIYNNTMSNIGQSFSAIALGNGAWDVHHNTLSGIAIGNNGSSAIPVWGDVDPTSTQVRIHDNILCVTSGTTYIAATGYATLARQAVISGNVYCGNGPGPAQDTTAVNADPQFVDAAAGDFRPRLAAAAGKGAQQ